MKNIPFHAQRSKRTMSSGTTYDGYTDQLSPIFKCVFVVALLLLYLT